MIVNFPLIWLFMKKNLDLNEMKNQIFIWNCSIFKLTCIIFIRKCVICSICFAIKYLIEKNFHFTVFSCLYENDKKSFSSVCFTVKWKKKIPILTTEQIQVTTCIEVIL